jgi:hypothetical protein
MTAFVETHFANTTLAFFDQAAMTAGETMKGVTVEALGQLRRAFGGHLIEDFSE